MKTNRQSKQLLIVGIPGMGKTTVGNYFSKQYEFTHIDMECENNIAKIYAATEFFIKNLLDSSKDIVVTWGFVPNEDQIKMVEFFRDNGFKLIWLDGDREAALDEFMKRDS